MTYLDNVRIWQSSGLRLRIVACVNIEALASDWTETETPESWVSLHFWEFAAQPGWSGAWASALASAPEADPGLNEAVITDGMILTAVQSLRSPQ